MLGIRREGYGVITPVARELGVGAESLRGRVNRADVRNASTIETSPSRIKAIAEAHHQASGADRGPPARTWCQRST